MSVRVPMAVLLCLLAGCAGVVREDARLSDALVHLADVALTTAENEADIREVVRRNVQGVRGHQVVFIGGHRFLIAPATLDRTAADRRHPTLIAQSMELAEDSCYTFAPERPHRPLTAVAGGPGLLTLTAHAERVQFVNVAIEMRDGCISAIHFEQASGLQRD